MTHSTPEERATKAATDFMAAVNEMSFDTETFAKGIRREHRTLQQSAMRTFVAVIRQWATDHETGNFDLRNQDTVAIANDIVQAVPNLNTSNI
jgi:hypothetical protein